MIGNIFFSFKEIDANGDLFKSWVELTSPLWEMLGSDPGDIVSQKRWLAFLEGGLLPIISLTSLHFFTKYDRNRTDEKEEVKEVPVINKPDENISDEEYEKIEGKIEGLEETIEDSSVKDEAGRWRLFGQNDHVRLYAHDDYVNKIRSNGFRVEELGKKYFGEKVYRTLGLKPTSILYVVSK
jgi:hypothetical protein